ncbi:MAG: hypothetical protein QF584_00785 [Candidatus Woesearchaeota archaeon]|jgi:phosphoribosylformylglycinamidine (FGAM) synthase PurS component|nr:hypothetical protein [Candidatus Woesearchaeota archaeon]
MPTIELFVSLKVPDNVAITTFNTLKRMDYKKLKKLERSDYYKFDVKDNIEEFKKQISNTDILINSNKHKHNFDLNNNTNNKKNNIKYKKINILVQDLDNGNSLLSTLKERLGFTNIKKLEKGILWTMYFDKKVQARKIAVDITKNLLMNENYQKHNILG